MIDNITASRLHHGRVLKCPSDRMRMRQDPTRLSGPPATSACAPRNAAPCVIRAPPCRKPACACPYRGGRDGCAWYFGFETRASAGTLAPHITKDLTEGAGSAAALGAGGSGASTKRGACRKQLFLLACSVSINCRGCKVYSSGGMASWRRLASSSFQLRPSQRDRKSK